MAVLGLTFTRVVLGLFLAYVCYNLFTFYLIFNPPQCNRARPTACLTPAYRDNVKLDLWVYASTEQVAGSGRGLSLLVHKEGWLRSESEYYAKDVNVSLPQSTLANGSLYAHVFVGPGGKPPLQRGTGPYLVQAVVPMTRHAVPDAGTFNLLSSMAENITENPPPTTHWIPWLSVRCLHGDWHFDRLSVPGELWRVMKFFPGTLEYLPIMYVDRSRVTKRHLKPVTADNKTMPLEVTLSSVGVGQMRLWMLFADAMSQLRGLGFGEKELDDVKGLLDNDLWLLGLTFFIAVFHLLFDFLAFKNDIAFWRGRKTMTGLSTRTILWRCFSQVVVFLYLLSENTSLLVLVPAGIASVIEFWKTGKALKLEWKFSGCIPYLKRGHRAEQEEQTESYDSQAMHYLSYVLYPLVVGGAIYQLVYSSHRSLYAWLINSLVNGVYAFGFLFMLPQLFLNYKLKSVAHLPWKAFMYKAFNTFIDDVFAFIIVMPTSHRIAVFRDDLVFLVYLYQRWLYPVDRTRVNEFGESFQPSKEHKD